MPVRVLKSVVLPAPLGPISEAIIPSSSLRLTRASACRPPNLLDMSRSSNSDMLQLPVLPRREDPLRPKNHHENQNQTKHHALIFRRFEPPGRPSRRLRFHPRESLSTPGRCASFPVGALRE